VTTGDENARRAQEDADFQRIVEGYGDVPTFPEPVEPAREVQVPAELAESPWLEEEHFVPSTPPPVPRPRGLRGLAWVSLAGIPLLVLVLMVAGLPLVTPLPFLLLVGFVASFGYLVATMSRGPSDPDSGWDDGAVL
jgi:hypothetical protein